MNTLRSIAWLVGAVSMAVWLNGCESSSPMSPSDSTPTTPTLTITGAGVSPTQLQVSVGQRVQIVNNDTSIHELQSNPNPAHGDCPPMMDKPGVVNPGTSGFTDAFTLSGTCGFHDHRNPDLESFQGFILVNVNEPDPDTPPAY